MRAVVRARIVALVRAVHAALAVGERAGPRARDARSGVAADVAEAAAAARGDSNGSSPRSRREGTPADGAVDATARISAR